MTSYTPLPPMVPVEVAVVIANVLTSGSAFAVRLDDGTDCYVPVSVAAIVDASVGDEFVAKLVPNRYPDKAERTPWLVIHLAHATATTGTAPPVQYAMPFAKEDPALPATPAEPSVADRVRHLMGQGGVWTQASLFEALCPGKTRGDALQEYGAISAAVRSMYAKGECAKFQLWRSSDQSKPSREWFTCNPDKADVDEWEE